MSSLPCDVDRILEWKSSGEGLVRSVGVVMYDARGHILMGREGRGNKAYGKSIGDYTFPWETWEKGKSASEMVWQACDEEGGSGIVLDNIGLLIRELPVLQTRATIFRARLVRALSYRGSAVESGEILDPGMDWHSTAAFLPGSSEYSPLPVRSGVRETLALFAAWRAGCRAAA